MIVINEVAELAYSISVNRNRSYCTYLFESSSICNSPFIPLNSNPVNPLKPEVFFLNSM
jgi:hypothetical protein